MPKKNKNKKSLMSGSDQEVMTTMYSFSQLKNQANSNSKEGLTRNSNTDVMHG